MPQNRWIRARLAGLALVLVLAAVPASGGTNLPAVTFTPAAPTSSDRVTANLPFSICAWTIVTAPAHVDINYIPAPCSSVAFTDKIPLGQLAPGTYTVTVNLIAQQGSPIPQAIGILGVAAALAALPALGPVGSLLCVLGLIGIAVCMRRSRRITR